MKLLRIKTRNLNSLYGEHEVDLAGALGSAPIFLIMGPTGAGKSTLMDAISLALFGQTPRLRMAKSDSEPDEDCRNVMSRGTGDALAQVELAKVENGRPVRYRATWECHRARKKADGSFRDPVRTLERAAGGGWETVVSNKQVKVYRPAFEEFLEGMKVEDFKRSMLLAQGEFSAFLKADEDERGAILERLTNTSRFRDLGARAAQRKQQAGIALQTAKDAIGSVQLLSEADENALRAQLETLAPKLAALRADQDALDGFITWRARLAHLRSGWAAAEKQLEDALAERQARAGNLARLGEHERCLPASPLLAELNRLRGDLAKLEPVLPPLRDEVRDLGVFVTEAVAEHERRAQEATTQVERAAALAPAIVQARRLRTQLAAAEAELTKACGALKVRTGQAASALALVTALEKNAATTASEQTQAEEALRALASSAPLVEALAGFRARHVTLTQLRQAIAGRQQRQAKDETAVAAARAALIAAREKYGSTAADLATLDARAAQARVALAGLLKGAADVAGRRRALGSSRNELTRRIQALDVLARDAEAQARAAAAVAEKGAALEQLRHAMAQIARELESGAEQLEQFEATRTARQLDLDDQRLLKRFARDRRNLKPGTECPLCGATEHPYLADGRHAEFDARIDARCAALEAELESVAKAVEATRGEQDDRRTEQAKFQAQAAAAGEDLVRLRAEIAERDGALGGRTADAIRAERAQLELEARAVDGVLDRLEAADRAEREASTVAAAAHADLKALAAKVTADEAALGEATARLEAAANELSADGARADAEEQSLTDGLAGFGIVSTAGAGSAIDEAVSAVERVNRAREAAEHARTTSQKVETDLQAARARHAAAMEAVAQAEAELAARRQAVDALTPKVAISLEGRAPEKVEAELGTAQSAAANALAQASRRASELQQQLAATRTRLEQLTAQREELAISVGEAAETLGAKMRNLGLGSEQDLAVRLLAPDEASALVEVRKRLDTTEESLRRLRDERQRDLAGHEQAQPEVRPDWSALDEGALAGHRATLAASVHQQMVRDSDLRAQLAQQERARATLKEKQGALETAQREFDTWDRLHRLIGVGDGKAFQRYAQTLNLAELIGRANHYLGTLAPRYELVRAPHPEGELPRLAFAIRDGFHAGEIRPINTLSGGETFLVSLALALGLAGYRTVKMPIETLLLDEGFGTLDPETLQVAMAALEALHATGTQVGVISHVEALKERIPARVLVERTGAGRSTVRVEAA